MLFSNVKIGVPKEIMEGERRAAVTVDTVKKIVNQGGVVLIEKGVGTGAYITDEDYEKAGAVIISEAEEVYAQADIILKVKEPQFNEALQRHEVDLMKNGQYLICFLHPASPENREMVQKLVERKVVAYTLDSIPRISRAQSMDALTSMSTVAGYKSVLTAAGRISKFVPMIGTAVGMNKPATVLVIGAGVAGLQAIATAKRLGAQVYVVDIRADALEQAKSLGAKVIDPEIPADIAVGEGGYAKKLPAEWLQKERNLIKGYITQADIVILTALIPGKAAPVLITEEMIASMKPGSAVIDVAVDQGGNCAVTVPGKVVYKYQVSIDGTKNIPAGVPVSSTWMFAHNIYNFLVYLMERKGKPDEDDEILSACLVTKDGRLLHSGALETANLQEKAADQSE